MTLFYEPPDVEPPDPAVATNPIYREFTDQYERETQQRMTHP
jgi:hypothetical protein